MFTLGCLYVCTARLDGTKRNSIKFGLLYGFYNGLKRSMLGQGRNTQAPYKTPLTLTTNTELHYGFTGVPGIPYYYIKSVPLSPVFGPLHVPLVHLLNRHK